MADADAPQQLLHVACVEDVANQPPGFTQAEFAMVVRGDAGGILAAVLQHQQGIVDVWLTPVFETMPTIPHIILPHLYVLDGYPITKSHETARSDIPNKVPQESATGYTACYSAKHPLDIVNEPKETGTSAQHLISQTRPYT
jgi:hypothetical protein